MRFQFVLMMNSFFYIYILIINNKKKGESVSSLRLNTDYQSKPNKQCNMFPACSVGASTVFSVCTRCRPAAAVEVHL